MLDGLQLSYSSRKFRFEQINLVWSDFKPLEANLWDSALEGRQQLSMKFVVSSVRLNRSNQLVVCVSIGVNKVVKQFV